MQYQAILRANSSWLSRVLLFYSRLTGNNNYQWFSGQDCVIPHLGSCSTSRNGEKELAFGWSFFYHFSSSRDIPQAGSRIVILHENIFHSFNKIYIHNMNMFCCWFWNTSDQVIRDLSRLYLHFASIRFIQNCKVQWIYLLYYISAPMSCFSSTIKLMRRRDQWLWIII